MQSQVACACSQIKKPAANNGINSLFSVSTHGFLALLTILFITDLQAITYCHLKMLSYDLAHISLKLCKRIRVKFKKTNRRES